MTKSQFSLFKKDLLSKVNCYGTKAFISYHKIKRPYKFGVNGAYSSKKNKITIKVYGNQSYLSVLLCLAHEVRHVLHDYNQLFPSYYNKILESDNCIDLIIQNKIFLDQKTALEAENDCNLFAREWALDKKINVDFSSPSYCSYSQPYPECHTLVSVLQQKARAKQLQIKLIED